MEGWTVESVAWSRVVDVTFRRGDRRLDAFIAPAGAGSAGYLSTARFRVGYRGDPPGDDGLRLLEAVAARLRDREARLGPDDPAPWPGATGAAEGLAVSDGVLELRVTCRCNEQCPFCNSALWAENLLEDPGAVEAALQAAPSLGVHTVHFTGGEPTLARELPDWVRTARDLGLRVVVQTNGLLLDRDGFWDAFGAGAAAALPDALFVSFHTARPERLEALTGVGGTLGRKVEGIRKALARGVAVDLNVVLQRANLDEAGDLPAFVAGAFGTSVTMVLSVVAPTGRAADRPDLWPTMAGAATALAAALDAAAALGIPALVPEACGVPACVLPDHRAFLVAARREVPVGPLARDRLKPATCRQCVADDRCIGIWRRYAEVRGTDEFRPLGRER